MKIRGDKGAREEIGDNRDMSEMNKDSKCRCVGRFAHWLSSIAKVCICAINNFYTLYIANLLVCTFGANNT